jgi:hypothetical protein
MKNYLLKWLATSLVIISAIIISGCEPTDHGFGVETLITTGPTGLSSFGVDLEGDWVSDYLGGVAPSGTIYSHLRMGKGSASYVKNGRCPATWSFRVIELPPIPCAQQSASQVYYPKKYGRLVCGPIGFKRTFITNPSSLQMPGSNNITISGPDISNEYGMPKVFIYSNADGSLIGDVVATSYGLSGTPDGDPWMGATVLIPSLPSGDYTYIVGNATPSGGYESIGGSYVYISNTSCGPPPPGCSVWDDVNCKCNDGCGSSSTGKPNIICR